MHSDPQANLQPSLDAVTLYGVRRDQKPSIVDAIQRLSSAIGWRTESWAARRGFGRANRLGRGGKSLQLLPSRFDFADNLTGAVRPDPKAWPIPCGPIPRKDLVLIDCAPTESVFTLAAYHASGLVLVPVKPEYFATIGFPLLRQSLTAFATRTAAIESTSPASSSTTPSTTVATTEGRRRRARSQRSERRQERTDGPFSATKYPFPAGSRKRCAGIIVTQAIPIDLIGLRESSSARSLLRHCWVTSTWHRIGSCRNS